MTLKEFFHITVFNLDTVLNITEHTSKKIYEGLAYAIPIDEILEKYGNYEIINAEIYIKKVTAVVNLSIEEKSEAYVGWETVKITDTIWLDGKIRVGGIFRCSHCGKTVKKELSEDFYKYCPGCKATMIKEEK